MILITGDTHADIDTHKLENSVLEQVYNLDDITYIIICGDFGGIWDVNKSSDREKHLLNWYAKKPWITLFIDGNHENHDRLDTLPMSEMFGGIVGVVNDKIFHLKRGEVYTIEDQPFFTFGGGESIDKARRVEFQSWWSQEIPNTTDIHNGLNNLAAVDNTVDYVITHTVYTKAYNDILIGDYKLNDPTYPILDMFENIITYKKWYASHFHFDIEVYNNLKILYNKVIRVGE